MLAYAIQERQAAARACFKLCKHHLPALCAHGPEALLDTTLINSPSLQHARHRRLPQPVFCCETDERRTGKTPCRPCCRQRDDKDNGEVRALVVVHYT